MGEVRESVVIKNGGDVSRHLSGDLAADEVRQVVCEGVVDTGAITLIIPQKVADAIAAPVNGSHTVVLPSGSRHTVPTVGPVVAEICGRNASVDAIVFGSEVLIGQIPLEFTDIWVDCQRNRLVPNPASPSSPVSRA